MKYFSYDSLVALNMGSTMKDELEKLEEECAENAKKYKEVFKIMVL